MKIVVDAQLPYAADRFGLIGDVEPMLATTMTRETLRDADALVVRSVTRVDRSLLEGTRIQFVGSATSGTDHVDLDYLRASGTGFASAAGANAAAVAEYVTAALLHLRRHHGFSVAGGSLGVVGCGHVGTKVAKYAAALGMRVVMNDPPLARATCEPLYRPVEEVLACDAISLHVPLEHHGPDLTHHLVDARFLAAMKPGSVLINSARGAIVDSSALKAALRSGRFGACVLDVWENEPRIDTELLDAATLGTAHIAGHTLDAKRRAVDMLVDAAALHFGGPGRAMGTRAESGANHTVIEGDFPALDAIEIAVVANFDIARESRRLRDATIGDAATRALGFESIRSAAPTRREFSTAEIVIDDGHPAIGPLQSLGFRVSVRGPVGVRQ